MYRFSIIIPVYNGAKYIKTTIDNVLKQTFKDFEIIIINDGSKDITLEFLKNYKEIHNINIISYSSNQGVSYARNLGIKEAKGEYLFFLDSDDFVKFETLKILNDILLIQKYDIISFGFIKKYNKKTLNYFNIKYNNSAFNNKAFLIHYFKREIAQCMCSFICKNEIIQNYKLSFDLHTYYAEDQEFQMKCMYFSKEIYYISEPLFEYNLSEDSSMNKKFSAKNLTSFNVFNRLIPLFSEDKLLFKYYKNYALYNYFSTIKSISKQKLEKLDFINKADGLTKLKPYFIITSKLSLIVTIIYLVQKINHRLLMKVLQKI